jgi:phosphoglycerol transferase MdoB-like AlkP superfamily enzyme
MEKLSIFWIGFFFLSRLVFGWLYCPGFPWDVFLYGLRFDLAALAFLLAPWFLLKPFPYLRLLGATLTGCLQFFYVLWTTVDIFYYPFGKKRLGYEAWVYWTEPPTSLLQIVQTVLSPWQMGLVLFGIGLLGFWVWFAMKQVYRGRKKQKIWVYLLGIPVLFSMARGGWQRVPLRTSDAYLFPEASLNHMVTNVPYFVLSQFFFKKEPRYLDAKAAQARALGILDLDGILEDPAYPLQRFFPQRTPNGRNLVFLLMESWTGSFLTPELAPHFSRLKSQGLFFPHFVASGFRTTSGIFSSLYGMPDQPGIPMMRRPELTHRFTSLPRLLKDQGYASLFVHGGYEDFDQLGNLLRMNRFDRILTRDQMVADPDLLKPWGFEDEVGFASLAQEIEALPSPFFAWFLSVSTHVPYSWGSTKPLLPPDTETNRYKNAVYYSDSCLGDFLKKMEQRPDWKDTILVIVGDHTHHGQELDGFQNQNVPLLIWSPRWIKPGVSFKPGSQVHILPTVADILGLPRVAAFGNSLLQEEKPTWGYFMTGQGMGAAGPGGFIHVTDLGTGVIPHSFTMVPFKQIPSPGGLQEDLLALYQFAWDLIQENRVASY